MKATIRFTCREFVGGFAGGTFPVAPGETIGAFMRRVLDENSIVPIDDLEDFVIVMRNAARASLSDAVEGGDAIYVLQRILGG